MRIARLVRLVSFLLLKFAFLSTLSLPEEKMKYYVETELEIVSMSIQFASL